jgi:hypothetical protein
VLERTDHIRKLDRLRRAELEKRERDARKTHNQLRAYRIWLLDTEAARIIADMKRVENPEPDVAKDLKRLESSITNREYREVVARLATAHYKRVRATLEKMSSRVTSSAGF